MFKGAIILGVGFTLGYVKALQESQDVKDGLAELIDLVKKNYEAKTAEPEVVIVDANAEAVEVPTEDNPPDPKITNEGE